MVKATSTVTARNVTATSIGGNTQIIFTIKSFFALIGSMIGIFFGFYMLVIMPRMENMEKNYEKMYQEQKELNKTFTKEITELKINIGSSEKQPIVKDNSNLASVKGD
jgi:uncharacterized membrane protein YgaE (UPF0421/DUF939 family)